MRRYFPGLTVNTFLLALASLFSDVSTEMLYPVLPVFLTQTLGASPAALGVIEGLAQAIQNLVQGFSGWLSDRLRRRKPIALAGYALSALAKPLIGLSTSWTGVLGARSTDRLGSGVRSAPRDALVAASADEQHRGKAFGLEGFGDNLGAFLGPLLTLALLSALAPRQIFFVALLPGLLAFSMVTFVRERGSAVPAETRLDLDVRRFPRGYHRYLFASALFGLGNSSNAFLLLRMQGLGASLRTTIFIYALYNLIAALCSYPAGHLSDRVGRRHVLLWALFLSVPVYAGFALVRDARAAAALFIAYGVYQGIFRAVGKSFAADFLPDEARASGIGWFTATLGMSGLIASIVGGQLWARLGPPATFFYGAAFALIGSLTTLIVVRSPERP